MSVNLRLPNITAANDSGKLQQVQSYLYQLVEQLNKALVYVDGASGNSQLAQRQSGAVSTGEKPDPAVTFNSIKNLIIKSADIVEAYYDTISARLEGVYVAESDFGSYAEKTSQQIQGNSASIEQLYSNLQAIITDIEGLEHSVIDVNAHIKSGLLYYDDLGVPVYGLEIGQRTKIDGEEVFNKYARFTSGKLAFYDQNGTEVAYISDQKLYITHAHITGTFIEGGFQDTVQGDGSIVTRWVGR